MTGARLSLEDALQRVTDQAELLLEIYRQNPQHVLEYPADMAIIDIFRAAILCIPRNDPAKNTMEHLIFDFENKRLNVKASQLLPAIKSLQGALQGAADKKNERKARGSVQNLRVPPEGNSQSRPRNSPPAPPLAQYRLTASAPFQNEWLPLMCQQ